MDSQQIRINNKVAIDHMSDSTGFTCSIFLSTIYISTASEVDEPVNSFFVNGTSQYGCG